MSDHNSSYGVPFWLLQDVEADVTADWFIGELGRMAVGRGYPAALL